MKTRVTIHGLATMAGSSVLVAALLCAGSARAATTTRVSIDSEGNEANYFYNGDNAQPAISGDGRYVVFRSNCDNLVADDTNDVNDVFLHDRLTGQTTRVSIATGGSESNGGSDGPAVSADGSHMAFTSFASDLVFDDTNGVGDIFVHEPAAGTTTRVSLTWDGNQANSFSSAATISADGRYVAFQSSANNLVADDTNGFIDTFVRDRYLAETRRVSVASDGTEANYESGTPVIACDGSAVAFQSAATNLVAGDTNAMTDIFVHDLETATTTRVSVASDGAEAIYPSLVPSISCDGRYVAFYSLANNLVQDDTNGASDIFVHDRETGETTRVSLDSAGNEASGYSSNPSISGNGRYVAFESYADDLVAGDTNNAEDIFVHDRESGVTIRASVDSENNEGNALSMSPALSVDARYVAFESYADNLVPSDTNDIEDVFVRGPLVEPQTLKIDIDIAWQRDSNQLNPYAGKLQVAVPTTESFDAADIDIQALLLFGPAEAAPLVSRMRDFDSDGDEDLLLFFETASTGISCGDTEATLTGQTLDGQPFEGTDTVVPVACD